MSKNNKDLPPYRQTLSPDKELRLWERWVKIRKEEVTKLAKKMGRPSTDLAMNLLQSVREKNEDKTILEHAQIVHKPKMRGELWEQPPKLKQWCYCKPVYDVNRTQAEMGRPPIMEYISVPTYIQKTEMGINGESQRKRFENINDDYTKYKQKREEELKNKIKKINPFRPISKNLMIKGERPKPPSPKIPRPPEIEITPATNICPDALSGVYAMRINNTIFYKDVLGQNLAHLLTLQNESWHENCSSWRFYFNVPVNKIGRSKLFLQNLGTVSIRYCWKKIKRTIPYIPDALYEQVFYFNKNEDVISPGQTKEILFTFISEKPGIYRENWELSLCNVCFFDNLTKKLTINFSADSTEDTESMKRKVEILKTRIHRKALDNLVTVVINEIFDNVFAVPTQIYPYKKYFLEAELFVMKNTVCFYHQTEVSKMKDLYTEMILQNQWDLSIKTWREIMMAKEYDERMKYYNHLKYSHKELLKPWHEGDDLIKEKHRAVKNLLKDLANKFDKEYDRINIMYLQKYDAATNSSKKTFRNIASDIEAEQITRNVFLLHMYEHVATTIELCAGILSSLDLNRWIEFNLCRT